MKALVLRHDADAAASCAHALIEKGFQVTCVETRRMAQALLRLETVDLLLIDEQVDGRLTHALALSAERRNPYISAIFITDRTGFAADELFELIPSVYGLVGSGISGRLIGRLALASIENLAEAEARVNRLASLVAEDGNDDITTMDFPATALGALQRTAVPKAEDLQNGAISDVNSGTNSHIPDAPDFADTPSIVFSGCSRVTVPTFMHDNAKLRIAAAY